MKKYIQDILTLGKTLLLSRTPSRSGKRGKGRVIVMGNGPSLRKTIDTEREALMASDRMAVNFAANAPEYRTLKPQLYILADPHFFTGGESDPNVARLWDNLAATSWPMTLWLPARYRRLTADVRGRLPECVTVKWCNLTPAEGGSALTRKLIDLGLAMPRPRNVLIPAIMCAIREGYDEIVTAGADHSWLQSLWVDDRNRVVSVQPHFYKDNDKELDRVAGEYAGYHLHDILGSMTIAFRSYFDIRRYAESRGIRILNATPGSYIDAFERTTL